MMIALYLLQLILTAAALAAAAMAWPGLFGHLRSEASVALALALTPQALALQTLALAAIWPGVPAAAFLLVPAMTAAVVLYAAARRLSWPPPSRRRADRAMWAILGLAVVAASIAGWRAASAPATAHDILIYLTEAKAFAAQPALASIPGFAAPIGQIVKTHPHQFLFQAYLAQALIAQGAQGYPHDLLARLAAQLPLALLMLSLFGLARTALSTWTAALAAPVMLLFHLEYVCTASSVDAFRLAPFLAMVALLLSCVGRHTTVPLSRILLIGALAGVSVAIHMLNIAFVLLCGLAVLGAAGLGWVRWRAAIRIGLACIPFLLIGLADYFRNWIEYGHPFGRGFYFFYYAGTPLAAVFARQDHWTELRDPFSAFFVFADIAGAGLMVVATVAGGVVLARSRRGGSRLALLALMLLICIWIPLIPGLGLQGAMLSNLRYGLVAAALGSALLGAAAAPLTRWVSTAGSGGGMRLALVVAAFAAIAIASVMGWLRMWDWGWSESSGSARALGRLLGEPRGFHRVLELAVDTIAILAPLFLGGIVLAGWRLTPERRRSVRFAKIFVSMIGVLPIGIAIATSLLWQFTTPAAARARVAADLAIARLAEALPPDTRWAADDYTISYYAPRPPLFLYSDQGATLTRATSEQEATDRLRRMRVGLVALRDPRPNWWPSMPLYRALTRPGASAIHSTGEWKVFVIPLATQPPGREHPSPQLRPRPLP